MIDKSIGTMMDEFHSAYGNNNDLSNVDLLILRRKLIKEEYEEVMTELDKAIMLEATYESLDTPDLFEKSTKDILDEIYSTREKILKELCDLAYVTAGCAYSLEMNFDGALHAVHQSNMSKLGEDGKPVLREDGKVLKGPNYKPARMEPYV